MFSNCVFSISFVFELCIFNFFCLSVGNIYILYMYLARALYLWILDLTNNIKIKQLLYVYLF